jgi:hypothetical protein
MAEDFRPLTVWERSVLDRLFEIPFPGRDEARLQLDACEVRFWENCQEHCGSLSFQVDEKAPRLPLISPFGPKVEYPLSVEGQFSDDDGRPIQILLFHKDGFLNSLEFVVFSDKRKRTPPPSEIEVILVTRSKT